PRRSPRLRAGLRRRRRLRRARRGPGRIAGGAGPRAEAVDGGQQALLNVICQGGGGGGLSPSAASTPHPRASISRKSPIIYSPGTILQAAQKRRSLRGSGSP